MRTRGQRWMMGGALLMGLALGACDSGGLVRGSGHVVSESRAVQGIDQVSLSGSGELTITQGGAEALTIEAEDNILPLLRSDVSSGRLNLGGKNNASFSATQPIRYRLTVKSLHGVLVSGSGDATAAQLRTDRFTVDISGSGALTVAGSADLQTVTISGSGSYTAPDFATKETQVTISGSGHAVVKASDRLDATVSGSGEAQYVGAPQVTTHISGSGSVRQR
jgi:hypothetical protein